MGAKVATKLPGRTPDSCRSRAKTLKVYRGGVCKKTPEWTKEEDDIIKKYYHSMGSKVASKLPGRSESACKNRARKILGRN